MEESTLPLSAWSDFRHGLLTGVLSTVLPAGVLLFAGCGQPPKGPPGLRTISVASGLEMEGVNELVTGATPIQTALLYYSLFLTLVEEGADYQDGPSSLHPQLAESWEFSEDRLALTFRLRDEISWSDGTPVTAHDVRWTWQAQTDPDIAWGFADAKTRITDVEVIDPLTVRFHFSEAYAAQILDANLGVILPKHAWSRLPFKDWRKSHAWFTDNLVVNGPFTLESWEPQQRWVLRRNERYFEPDLPKIDRVVFQVVPDPTSQLALLRSGQVQFVEWITPADADAIIAHPDLRLTQYLARHFFFIQWNVERPLFTSRTVRQALTMAIDRESMVDSLHHGYAHVSHSPFTSNTWVHNSNLEPWPYDPQRARELLASAGWTDSDGDGTRDRDGQPFRFELLTNSGNTLRRDIMVMVQAQLREIGIDVRTRLIDFNAMMVPLRTHDFDAIIFGIAIDTSFNTYHFFHSRAIDDGFNWGSYSSPEVDRLIEEIESQIDQVSAKPLFDRLQEVLHEDQSHTFLYEAIRLGGAHKSLLDIHPNNLSSYANIRNWRLADGP